MMRKLVSMCCALLLACALAVPVSAEESGGPSAFQYELNGGHISLQNDGEGKPQGLCVYESDALKGDVIIPESVDGKPVVSLYFENFPSVDGSHYFCLSDNQEMTSITLPSTLMKIYREEAQGPGGVFDGCGQLKEIVFQGGGPEIIPQEAFGTVENLERIVLPKRVKELGPFFCDSKHIKELVLDPDNPYLVKDSQGIIYNREMTKVVTALEGADSREVVQLPGTVTEIAEGAFANNIRLKEVRGLSRVEKIGAEAFYGCEALLRAELGPKITWIQYGTFGGCASLKQVWIPTGVTSLGDYAFGGCTSLEEAFLPDTLKVIHDAVFFDCNRLREITLPASLGLITAHYGEYSYPFGKTAEDFQLRLYEGTYAQELADQYEAPYELAEPLPFTDLAGHWGRLYAEWAYKKDLLRGTGETEFSPNQPMTRGMLVTVLYRLAGEPAVETKGSFPDVKPGAYYEKAAVWAAERGIVLGSGGNLCPGDPVTREQLAAMLYRYACLEAAPEAFGTLDGFEDRGQISAYAREAATWAVGREIFLGKGDGRLDPGGRTTRAEAAAMLRRYLW